MVDGYEENQDSTGSPPESDAARGPLWSRARLPLLGCLVCLAGFWWRAREFEKTSPPEVQLFDTQLFGYGPARAEVILASLRGEDVAPLYVLTQLTLDMAFPIAYCLLLRALARGIELTRLRRLLLGAAVAVAGFDIAENLGAVSLVRYGAPPHVVWLTSFFTLAKWWTLPLLLGGLAFGLLRRPRPAART